MVNRKYVAKVFRHRWLAFVHSGCDMWDDGREVGQLEGRDEGAAVVFGLIALGTWAAECARAHRFAEANAEVIAKYGETFERLAEHDAAPEACEDPESCGQWWECRACGESFAFRQGLRVGRNEGAAVVAGVIALGTWAANGPLVVERSYWTSEIDGRHLYDCTCAGCGCDLKGLEAGVHEGADREWCGVCRG